MDFTALRYFLETAECRSIRQASDRLHVAPSAVSRKIAKLEHDLKAKLFERRAKGMKLTAAGLVLVEQLHGTVRDLDRARWRIAELEGLKRGEVIVHCIEGVVENWLPRHIARFKTIYPEINFRVAVMSTDRIIEALMAGDSDIGIVFITSARPEIRVQSSQVESLSLVVAPQHPLARRRQVALADVVQHTLVMPDQSFGIRRIVDRHLSAVKLVAADVLETNSVQLVRSLVRHGVGCTLLPHFSVERDLAAGLLVSVKLRDSHLLATGIQVCVHRQRALSAAAQAFLNTISPASPAAF
ncbi:LysR family transcriptional regulator [Bradyrhizobium sp. dw_78]|uniref:LysR family transcriptional regulator n=1 Tax=Bradyrhizobium sp. dw_78 TaxID=2719793 RepID=UPI001BD1C71C|nr:LysR family transcriptional regulator [Bradyrhizobium sp. dw_78]